MKVKHLKIKQFNMDNEVEFLEKTRLGKLFKLIFKNEYEAKLVYRILKFIKKQKNGLRVYGSTYKMCKMLNISYTYYMKLLKKLEELRLIEYVKHAQPIPIEKTLKKEDTKLAKDVTLHLEKRHKGKFIVLSDSTYFVMFLSWSARDWIQFKRPPSIEELFEEMTQQCE